MSSHAQTQFDGVAQAYLTSAVHAQGDDLLQVAQALAGNPGARVLDVGCGAGHLSFAVAPGVAAVVAYDLSPRMLDVVAQAAAARGLHNISTRQGPAEVLPFADGSFDAVVTRYSAHHWDRLPTALAEMQRVLVPEGRLFAIDVVGFDEPLVDTHLQAIELLRDASHVRDYAVGEWAALLAAAGFTLKAQRGWSLPIEFDAWVARSRTPDELVLAIRRLMAGAPALVQDRLKVQGDGSFELPVCLFEARRPA